MNERPQAVPGTIVWIAPFYNRSGFGVGARAAVSSLHRAGARIRTIPVNQVEPGIDDCDMELIKSLENTDVTSPITAIISHVPSRAWLNIDLPKPNIRILATTVFDCCAEGGEPPTEMLDVCREMDFIWVQAEQEREAFLAAGFSPDMVRRVHWPHPWLGNPVVVPSGPEQTAEGKPFRFLNISLFLPRRRWDTLIEAYLEEFKSTDNVELYLKVNYPSWHPVPGKPKQDLRDLLAALRKKTGSKASIIVDEELGNRSDIIRLIDSCNVYVSTDTAITAPLAEAWVRQRLVVVTDGIGIGIPSEHFIAIPADPSAKTPLTAEMLLYQPNHRGSTMPLLHVQDVRNALRNVYDMTPEQRFEKGRNAVSFVLGPDKTVPQIIDEIDFAWAHKSALDKARKKNAVPRRIAWEGSQLVCHSLALINRELCLRLIESGHEVSIIPFEAEEEDLDAASDPRFPKIVERTRKQLSGKADVHVRHFWPPSFTPPQEGRWVIIQPWEFGSIPRSWIEPMSAMVDEIWACSSFVRECYIESGMPADRVFVVPNGVDTGRFNPDAPPVALLTRKRFKFLFVGGTIYRKGIDILLEAYCANFSSRDDVCLVIKDMGGKTFYQNRTALEKIREYQSRPDAPEIEYIDRTLDEAEMAGLYTACDCLVHPYRGEGFGIPIAEAMACEKPVIVTGYGAALDFCSPDNAYLIPSQVALFPEKRIENMETVDFPWLAEPDRAALGELMRHVLDNPEEARAKGQAARIQIETNFTWEKSAEAVEERLQALVEKPIRRFENAPLFSTRAPEPGPFRERKDSTRNERADLAQKGREALHDGDLDRAEACLLASIRNNPFDARAHRDLSTVLLRRGSGEEALNTLLRAMELAPNDLEILLQCTDMLCEFGRAEDAREILTDWLAENPRDERVRSRLEKLEPPRPATRAFDPSEFLTDQGERQFEKGRPDRARICFEIAIEKDPSNSKAHSNLGVIAWQEGDLPAALEHFRKAIDLNPEDPDILLNSAKALKAAGEAATSAALFRVYLEKNPEDDSAWDEHAEALRQSAGSKWKPDGLPDGVAEIFFNMAVKLAEGGDILGAGEALRKVLALDPGRTEAYSKLGEILCSHGDMDDALVIFRAGLGVAPLDKDLVLSAGGVLARLGRKGEAAALYEEFLASCEDGNVRLSLDRLRPL
ncbi:MAG: tetratricopeptide repeat protein [Desulfobacteraceae bacterium]|nr:tetratricopeptide repeat protein [Desulfobacteraceae bacterium]